jgi:hypothetical protein
MRSPSSGRRLEGQGEGAGGGGGSPGGVQSIKVTTSSKVKITSVSSLDLFKTK